MVGSHRNFRDLAAMKLQSKAEQRVCSFCSVVFVVAVIFLFFYAILDPNPNKRHYTQCSGLLIFHPEWNSGFCQIGSASHYEDPNTQRLGRFITGLMGSMLVTFLQGTRQGENVIKCMESPCQMQT